MGSPLDSWAYMTIAKPWASREFRHDVGSEWRRGNGSQDTSIGRRDVDQRVELSW